MIEFTEATKHLIEPLSKASYVSRQEVLVDPTFIEALQAIKDTPKKRRDRTDEEIERDVFYGKICEVGIKKLLVGSTIFDAAWDLKDRQSYGKDVISKEGVRIEVKSTKHKHRFALAQKSFYTLSQNIKEDALDIIVVASAEYQDLSHDFIVTPQMIIDPSTFELLCDMTTLGFTNTHVYRDDLAIKRGLVVYLNKLEV